MDRRPEIRRRLPWWFWVVLFLPAALACLVPFVAPYFIELADPRVRNRAMQILSVQVQFLFFFFVPSNLVCSLIAGRIHSRMRPGGPSPTSMLGNAVLFFFMNLVIAFAGCTVPAYLSEPFRR